jgi:hypothetical protein
MPRYARIRTYVNGRRYQSCRAFVRAVVQNVLGYGGKSNVK